MDIKKIIAGTTAVAVIAIQALSGMAFAASTATANTAWTDAVNFMKTQGLSSTANTVAEYAPMATVKREAASKFFVAFAKKEFGMKPDTTKVCNFSDINKANSVFVPYIIEACQMGILHGVDGKFMPKATLTKLQFLTVLARIVKNDPTIQPANAFNVLKAEGITKADSLASTVRPVSRIELAMLFKRGTEKFASSKPATTKPATDNSNIGDILGGILGGDTTTTPATTTGNTTTVTTTGNTTTATTTGNTTPASTTTTTNNAVDQLVVALDPATPAAQYVPGNGTNVQVLKVDLTAGSKDVTVNTMNVKLAGMISRDHIKNVYIEDENGTIISNQRNFGLDYTAMLRLNNGYVVKAGTVASVYVVIDLTNSTNELFTVSVNEVEASTTSVTGLPVVSNEVHTTSYSSETLTFTAQKTGTDNTYYVGDTNKEIGMFKLSAGSSHNRDINLKSLRFKIRSGSNLPTSRIDNLKLVVNGKTVSTKATIDGRYITFTTDYTIPYGTNRTFYVYADIVGVVSSSDYVQFYLDKNSDISALEVGTNASVSVSGEGDNSHMEKNTLKEGDNLITKSSASPTSTYISNDATDETVLVANVNVTNTMSVDKFDVRFNAKAQGIAIASQTNITGAKLIDTIKQVSLYINGKVVDTTSTYSRDSTEKKVKVEFNYYGDLKGSNTFKVTVDTANSAKTNDYISNVTLKGKSFVDATYVSTDNNVTDSNIKGEATSPTFTVQTPEILSVSRTDGFSSTETFIAGASNLDVMGATVQANNVRDLTINTVTIELTGSASTDYIPTAKLVVNGQVVDTESVNGSSVTFNGLNIPVAKGGTQKLDVQIDTTTSITAGKTIIPKIESISYVDTNGNSYTYSTVTNGVTWTAANSATLAMTLNSNSPVEQVVAANPNVETEVARFDFRPTNDNAQIQELLLANMSGTNVTTNADSLIQNVYIYDTNGNKLGTASLANGYVDFNFATSVELPKDTTTTLIVKVQTNSINSLDLTNKNVKFAIAKLHNTQETKVVSEANGVQLTLKNNYNDPANKIYFRKTLLTFANNAQTTTSLVNGSNDIYLWSATADQAGAAKIKEFNLDLSMNGASLENGTGDYELYINGSKVTNTNVNIVANGTGSNATSVVIKFIGNYSNGYEISAGSTANFKLVATNVANAQTNDSITVRLNNNGNYVDKFAFDQLNTFEATNTQYDTGEKKLTTTTGTITIATGTLAVDGYGKLESSTVTFTGTNTGTGTKLVIDVLDKDGTSLVSYSKSINVALSGSNTEKLDFPDAIIANAKSNYTYTVKLEYTGATASSTKVTPDSVTFVTAADNVASNYSVVWSDEASKDTTTLMTDGWFTDADLLSLPLNGETITK